MKRGALGELDGSLQPAEKAVKEGGAGPALVGADPLFVFLCELSPEDANEWLAALHGRRVRSLDDLKGLARLPNDGWGGFLQELCDKGERVLASKLNVWKQGWAGEGAPAGEKRGVRVVLLFSFFFFLDDTFHRKRFVVVADKRCAGIVCFDRQHGCLEAECSRAAAGWKAVVVRSEEGSTIICARVLCVVLRRSSPQEVRSRLPGSHLHGQPWHWKEHVAELCAGAFPARWLHGGVGARKEKGFLCVSRWALYLQGKVSQRVCAL